MHTRYRSLHFSIVGAPSRAVAYNIAKQQNIRCIASSLKFLWCGSMECNMEENFSMEWNMEENFSMECQKKSLQKSFSANLQFIGVARIFDW